MARSILDKIKTKPVIHVNRSETGKILGVYIVGYEWRFVSRLLWMHPALVVFSLFVFGLTIVSVSFGWPQLFSRCGALLVAVGVFLEFSATKRVREEAMRSSYSGLIEEIENRIDEYLPEQLASWDSGKDSIVSRNSSNFPEQVVKQASRADGTFVRAELMLVAAGTLIWAFGDWLVCLLHKWSECNALL